MMFVIIPPLTFIGHIALSFFRLVTRVKLGHPRLSSLLFRVCLSYFLLLSLSQSMSFVYTLRALFALSHFFFTSPFNAIASLFLPTDNLCPFMNVVFVKDVLMSLGDSLFFVLVYLCCLFVSLCVCLLVNKRLKEVSGLAC